MLSYSAEGDDIFIQYTFLYTLYSLLIELLFLYKKFRSQHFSLNVIETKQSYLLNVHISLIAKNILFNFVSKRIYSHHCIFYVSSIIW